jgi:soluble lytic murein transglycosylase-like protein
MSRFLWRWFGYEPRDLFWLAVLVGLFLVCAVTPRCAHGEELVTPSLVCATQHAIRWRDAAWTERQCEARAREFVASGKRWSFEPAQLFAMAINESDLRTEAMSVDRGAVDVGLMAVRCKRAPSPDWRCTNKPVRGLYVAQLMRPAVNIDMGARILATLHHGSLASYNGGPNAREHGYPEKVGAIMAALGGVEVRVSGKRMRKLVRQIVAAVAAEGKP